MDGKQYFTSFGICSTNGNARLKSNRFYRDYIEAKKRRVNSIERTTFLPYQSRNSRFQDGYCNTDVIEKSLEKGRKHNGPDSPFRGAYPNSRMLYQAGGP